MSMRAGKAGSMTTNPTLISFPYLVFVLPNNISGPAVVCSRSLYQLGCEVSRLRRLPC